MRFLYGYTVSPTILVVTWLTDAASPTSSTAVYLLGAQQSLKAFFVAACATRTSLLYSSGIDAARSLLYDNRRFFQ